MLMTLTKWNEKHNPSGLTSVFDARILVDIEHWAVTTQTGALSQSDFIDYLLFRFGSAVLVDYDASTLATLTRIWHLSNNYKFAGIAATMRFDYDPISNYDRTETETTQRTPNLTNTETRNTLTTDGGTTTTQGSVTDSQTADSTGSVAPFDSATFANAQKSATTAGGTSTDSQTVTHGKTQADTGTVTHNETGTDTTGRQSHVSGNIGVTTTQDMIRQEREIINFNFLEYYCKEWVNAITCGVWALGCDVATD